MKAKLTAESINELSNNSLMSNMGIVCTALRENYVECTMPVDVRTKQIVGVLHGGATLALAETMAGCGSMFLCQEDEIPVGVQVSGNHISPAYVSDTVRAVAMIVHKGASTHLWNIDVFTSEGKLISTVRVLNSILKKR